MLSTLLFVLIVVTSEPILQWAGDQTPGRGGIITNLNDGVVYRCRCGMINHISHDFCANTDCNAPRPQRSPDQHPVVVVNHSARTEHVEDIPNGAERVVLNKKDSGGAHPSGALGAALATFFYLFVVLVPLTYIAISTYSAEMGTLRYLLNEVGVSYLLHNLLTIEQIADSKKAHMLTQSTPAMVTNGGFNRTAQNSDEATAAAIAMEEVMKDEHYRLLLQQEADAEAAKRVVVNLERERVKNIPFFVWSYMGPDILDVHGLQCMYAGEDIPGWGDNVLCVLPPFDLSQWRYTNAGPPPADMNCVKWYEPSSWWSADNYICRPKNLTLDYNYAWSYAGPIPGMTCTRIVEPSGGSPWTDNFFCVSL